MTPMKVKKPFEHADASEHDAMPVERYLFFASMLGLVFVVLTLISTVGDEGASAIEAVANDGARFASALRGAAIDAANVGETRDAGAAPAAAYSPDP